MSEPTVAMPVPRPWVQLATLCQTALTENTGQVSIIRIVNRWIVVGATPEMQPTNIQLTLAIILKSDQMRGQYQLRVRLRSPTGNVSEGPELPALFEGDDRGVQAILPSGILATEQGLYWFEVLVEEEVVTRVPLRILYHRIQLPPGVGLADPGAQTG